MVQTRIQVGSEEIYERDESEYEYTNNNTKRYVGSGQGCIGSGRTIGSV